MYPLNLKKLIPFFGIIVIILTSSFIKKQSSFYDYKGINISDTTPGAYFFSINTEIESVEISGKTGDPKHSLYIIISWNCNYCDHIYIDGLDSIQRPNSGKIIVEKASINYDIIGVSGNSVFSKAIYGSIDFLTQSGSGSGSGYFLSPNFEIRFLKKSWVYPFKSNKSLNQIQSITTNVLQAFQYMSERSMPDANSLLFECEPYQQNPLVCLDDDCQMKIGSRRIERKLSIDVGIEKKGNEYSLYIKPSVIRNFRKQDDEWRPDPQFLESSKNACDEIAKEIISQL